MKYTRVPLTPLGGAESSSTVGTIQWNCPQIGDLLEDELAQGGDHFRQRPFNGADRRASR